MTAEPDSPSRRLLERAAAVIPGGIYGHTSPAVGLPDAFPPFAVSADGCRYRDADGREWLDFMCGYGPVILGYGHPAVEEAAATQREAGNVFNHPTARMVELAETLTTRITFADWAVFGRNGSDLTTWAIQVAREHTGRPKVLMAEGAYHGVDAWCTPGHGGLIAEDRVHIHRFRWNDPDSLEMLLKTHVDQVAAVILTPYHHPAFAEADMPADGWWATVERLCRRHGALLVLDDIRAGFRLHPAGSHRRFGFTPDIAVYCKALANGYPISAALGTDRLKPAAGRVFLTGSFWNNAVPMAAALACLREMDRLGVVDRLEQLGARLAEGLVAAGREAGFDLRVTGPVSMPTVTFGDDPDLYRVQAFCREVCRRGVFFHPHHNWFLSAAHDEAAVDTALRVSREALGSLRTATRDVTQM
ncbi:MAG: aminotransferase class III-fold pyridoxal phosphate-dependent enzyme [Opitutales bacterium]